ncbi:TonB-like protein [Arcicella aurantiaca]|uniref:TonB-like protein n=1 Tax=Arcicella aurantiaca TaxID=591202 RepID=A0A316DG70_9BACT|nr:energy transducer TonB [Arcicella aurantiaca]PWK16905.1 TonB-like protein [Arcicella aurantiaca]
MKKLILFVYLLSFISPIFSQSTTSPEEYYSIQRFVEATVQIPFMARVADVQGSVTVRIIVGDDDSKQYEIVQNLRPDCDKEALRVVKLLSNKLLKDNLKGKKKTLLVVPFFNPKPIFFKDGLAIEYYDKKKKPTTNQDEVEYASRYFVDTLTGRIKSDVEYFEIAKKRTEPIGKALLEVDSLDRNEPTFFENAADSLKMFYYRTHSNSDFKEVIGGYYSNGQAIISYIGDKHYRYFPNGRIKQESELVDDGKKMVITDYNWFANGQMAYVRVTEKTKTESIEKIIAVWDTLGTQIVKDGQGWDEYYEGKDEKMIIHAGLIKDGLFEGKWTGKSPNGELKYREVYKNGKCLNGVAYLGKDSTTYETPSVPAEFKGGKYGFATFLERHLNYPSKAQRSNVSGKVYVQFVVCTDGTLCDYKVLKGIGFGCDEESVRVLQASSGKWIPGKYRGKAVRSKFTIPINYQLSR